MLFTSVTFSVQGGVVLVISVEYGRICNLRRLVVLLKFSQCIDDLITQRFWVVCLYFICYSMKVNHFTIWFSNFLYRLLSPGPSSCNDFYFVIVIEESLFLSKSFSCESPTTVFLILWNDVLSSFYLTSLLCLLCCEWLLILDSWSWSAPLFFLIVLWFNDFCCSVVHPLLPFLTLLSIG